MISTRKHLNYLITFMIVTALLLPAQYYVLARSSESYSTSQSTEATGLVAFNKTSPANGSTISMPSTSYYLLLWTDALLPDSDRYQYCIDQTNNNACDNNQWVTRDSLYSGGPDDITFEYGKTYYWQVRARDAGVYANGGNWWSFTITNIVPSFSKTTPANGATIAMPASTYYLLQWTDFSLPSTDRYQYCIDQTNNNSCDSNTWITRNSLYSGTGEFTLTPGKTYYWQVRTRDSGVYADGGAWRAFTISGVAPVAFNKTTPTNGTTIATPASVLYLLQWTDLFLPSTDRYQYCIDQTNNNSCDSNTWITRNSLYSGTGEFTLTPGKTYYWQTRSRDSGVYADGGAWSSFTISGATPTLNKTTPANGATIAMPANTYYLLQWTDLFLPSTDRYQYCIDQTNNNSCDSNTWITRNSLYSGTGEFTLTQGKTYYWQVRSRDSGVYADGGAWSSFTISGATPTLNKTTPANGATISMPANTYYLLQWTDLFLPSTDRYQYCIDQTNNNSCDANNWITRNSLYSGSGEFTLTYGATYYWQVRTRDSSVYADGGAWRSFTIQALAPAPSVVSILRASPDGTNAATVDFTVTFSQSVTGVDISDFTLNPTIADATISGLSGSGTTYTITVNTGTVSGTLRLNFVDNDTVQNNQSTPVGGVGIANGNYDIGEIYTIIKP